MNWKNTLRKQEIDMDIGSTNYAKDLGDSVKFGEGGNAITVPKSKLVELVSRYNPSIKRMKEITMSSSRNDDFVRWLNENMDSPISKAPLGRFKRKNKGPYKGDFGTTGKITEGSKIENVQKHMYDIHNAFKDDANFKESGYFAIKAEAGEFTGRGRKRGLVWDMQTSLFGNAEDVFKHGIPILEELGYTVERKGANMIVATKR